MNRLSTPRKPSSSFGPARSGDPAARRLGRWQYWRLRMVFWLLGAGFVVVAWRLYDVQATPNFAYKPSTGWQSEVIPRGRIFDRHGGILARDRLAPSLGANPGSVIDPERLADRLAAVLDVDREQVLDRLTRESSDFVWIKRWMSEEECAALERNGLLKDEGVDIRREFTRCYPENDLAAHILGFADLDRVGREGIEASCNKWLESKAGKRTTAVDGKRRPLMSRTVENIPPEGGHDVYLSISKPLQHLLEQELQAVLTECKAPRSMGMLMDPQTGAILALACTPTFDPNRYGEFEAENRRNRTVVDTFEPGSVFKIVTAAAALEERLITRETLIDCENGAFNPYGHRIRDFHSLGTVPFKTTFAQSSNIAMIKVAAMLGPDRLEQWIRTFGFGQQVCRDFQLEDQGIFRPKSRWSRLSMGSLPMGQEIAVTMPQLARAFAAIANGGFAVEPHLVERTVSREGRILYEYEASSKRTRILSEKTAATMRDLCHLVVTDEHGTGRYANIAEFRVGGKTGTAQVARPDGRGYYPDKYTTVFAGFAPLADPKLCAVIVVHEPAIRRHYGGFVCGPVFKRVVREALIRMNCPKDPVLGPVQVAEAAATGEREDADTVVARLAMDELEPTTAEILAELDALELIPKREDSSGEGPGLPDLKGMTKRQAKHELASLELTCDARGSGWVVSQDPPAGTPIGEVSLCRLVFSSAGDEPADRKELHDARTGDATATL